MAEGPKSPLSQMVWNKTGEIRELERSVRFAPESLAVALSAESTQPCPRTYAASYGLREGIASLDNGNPGTDEQHILNQTVEPNQPKYGLTCAL
jgi:hypothetical protein